MTPLSETSVHPLRFSNFNEVLYLDSAYKHLSDTCLFPSKLKVFKWRNFFTNINMQLSEIVTQYDKSTSSNIHWCSANASTAPVVNHAQRASFNVCKLLQYRITGCRHFADKFLHWLKFKVTNFWFLINIGIKSLSVIDIHRLRFNTVSLLQVSASTWNKHLLIYLLGDASQVFYYL